MIPFMFGEEIYEYFKQIKQIFDPNGIFNPGKIVDAPRMNTFLRIDHTKPKREFQTYFNFDNDGGFSNSIEKCNGSGDCRKPQILGGTMCPSYKATLDEKHTTRARANALREIISKSNKGNPFVDEDLMEVFSLCLSCKACKSECPSNVDVTKLKAEFLQHYYDDAGVPFNVWMIGNLNIFNRIGSFAPKFYNFIVKNKVTSSVLKYLLKFEQKRQLPELKEISLKKWDRKHQAARTNRQIYLFADEFTNYFDSDIGVKAILLLEKLGYGVKIAPVGESGRTFFSKGLLKRAKKIAEMNVRNLADLINENTPLLGLEPSAILTFRDEYKEIVSGDLHDSAKNIARHTFLLDEFLANEFEKGQINSNSFTEQSLNIMLHTHCHQKALAGSDALMKVLSIPENYQVEEIKSGCCGMAGSFGFEKDKYDVSMKIGELALFPAVRNAPEDTIIVANGTSCRHQIAEGTSRKALHFVEVLYDAMK
ncbi:MAG: hypothetical protein A2X64_08575 [Ignavibacteria bacterium GWF2_33_9]|nr:MAG: hypothetical protein A2X64_08575 [Ignavibacteria bacterium GWF2_33_9]